MRRIRFLEQHCLKYYNAVRIGGWLVLSIGQELLWTAAAGSLSLKPQLAAAVQSAALHRHGDLFEDLGDDAAGGLAGVAGIGAEHEAVSDNIGS